MFNKSDVKRLFPSRSIEFVCMSRKGAADAYLDNCRWDGKIIHFQFGTSDPGMIYKTLLKRGRQGECRVPAEITTDVVRDIGISTYLLCRPSG